MRNVTDIIIGFYLNSNDFNGIPFQTLLKQLQSTPEVLQNDLQQLFIDGLIDIVSSKYVLNPHIKQFSNLDRKKLLNEFTEINNLNFCCFYPSVLFMQAVDKSLFNKYEGKPYLKNLALGYGQLEFKSFDMSILELYRNDPRYYYSCNDIQGVIYIIHEQENNFNSESDKVYLQTFSFCYSEDYNQRYVAVFNRYLCDLSEEHQLLWMNKEVKNTFRLNPVYIQNSILGEFSDYISLTDAFLEEIKIINKMCALMNKPTLFKQSYVNEDLPEFSFLLRPTLKEYNNFIHLLDKLISDNINKDFFEKDLSLEQEEERKDGKIIIKYKGTIQLLNEWLDKFFKTNNQEHIKEIIPILKEIRKLRQKPAHTIEENKFDNTYYSEQRKLLNNAYKAIRTIRLIFANHPNVKLNPPKIIEPVFYGKILDY